MQTRARTSAVIWTAALLAAGGAIGCSDRLSPTGAACQASDACATGLCYVNVCLVPGRDEDNDGLDNATEHSLGSNPLAADTDNDGKPDGAEVGADPSHPNNRDGDALADLLESAVADSDHDCLADEVDAQNNVQETDGHALAAIGCGHAGVCAAAGAAIVATCKNSVLTCNYDGVPGFAGSEACDGKDNDCDGETDEGFADAGNGIGEPCIGVGACGSGVVECHGAKADCSTNRGASHDQSKAELCNGVDDNCDGLVDEGFVFDGLPVGSPCLGIGECGLGIVECGPGGAPRCSSNPSGSAPHAKSEICNGLDDDCDGVTDNDLAWQGTALGKACSVTGICGAGVVICSSDGKATCSSAPGVSGSKAQAEICNGLDDNCNGTTDEGFDFQGIALGAACPAVGICAAGVVICSAGGAALCSTHDVSPKGQASPELCNGQDDDCDGETDEQLSWLGNALGANCDGTGACGAGIVECGKAGQVTCSTNPDGSAPQTALETCDGADNDCDGQVDNNIASTPGLTCPSSGVCADASPTLVCAGGGWQCTFSNPAFQITETTCDGLDNDCDGLTDENLPLVWTEPTESWTTRPVARTELASAYNAAALFVIGGVVDSLLPGTATVNAPDVWRLDLQSKKWSLVAHNPLLARRAAGAVFLPGAAGGAPQLLIIGGLDGQGAPAAPVQLDIATGVISMPVWKNQPQHRFSPAVVRLGPAQQIWLFGGTASGAGAAVQRLDLATGIWSASVPQPATAQGTVAAAGPIAACANAAGDLYAFGQTVLGEAFFALLPAGAATWQMLPTVPGKSGQPGRLLCDLAADEVWLVGGVTQGDTPQPARKFAVSSQQWTIFSDQGTAAGNPATGSAWPGPVSPAVAVENGLIVAALGQTPDGQGLPATWLGLPGQWTAVDATPEPVVGARLTAIPGGVVRVGGAALRVGLAVFDGPTWRHTGGQWSSWPAASGAGRAFANVITEPDGKGLLQWGGITSAPANGDWLAALETQSPAAGAEHLDLQSGTWQVASSLQQKILPPLRPDAAITAGALPGQWFVLGSQPSTGVPQLWLIDLAKMAKTLLWQGPDPASGPTSGDAPVWHAGSALSWDPSWGRVLYACNGVPSALWHYDFGPNEGWTQTSDNLGISGRLQWLGADDATDRLLIATSLQSQIAVRHLALNADIAVTTPAQPQLTIFGIPAVTTAAKGVVAWLAEPTDANGVLRSVWVRWNHTCQP